MKLELYGFHDAAKHFPDAHRCIVLLEATLVHANRSDHFHDATWQLNIEGRMDIFSRQICSFSPYTDTSSQGRCNRSSNEAFCSN